MDKQVLLISLALFAAFVILSSLFSQPSFMVKKIQWQESPLEKNTNLSVTPGERYVYSYKSSLSNITMDFLVREGNGCTIIELTSALNRTFTCLNEKGNDVYGSNATLEPPAILLFKPWMLALKRGWEWRVKSFLPISGVNSEIDEYYFAVQGIEKTGGRESFHVRINNSETAISVWVDEKKRILLKEKGPKYELILVKAPFPLKHLTE